MLLCADLVLGCEAACFFAGRGALLAKVVLAGESRIVIKIESLFLYFFFFSFLLSFFLTGWLVVKRTGRPEFRVPPARYWRRRRTRLHGMDCCGWELSVCRRSQTCQPRVGYKKIFGRQIEMGGGRSSRKKLSSRRQSNLGVSVGAAHSPADSA
jgi:hypothetical protein